MSAQYLLFSLLLGIASCTSAPILSIEFDAGNHDRIDTPLIIELNESLPAGKSYRLVSKESGKELPAQLMDNGSLAVFVDQLPAGTRQTFELRQGTAKTPSRSALGVVQEEEGIQFTVDERPMLFYQTQTAYPPEGEPDYYKRSGMIHPLYSPGGKVLTDAFPVGHTHQHAIFNAWVNTQYKGEKVDFWNQHQGTGTVEHKSVLGIEEGPNATVLRTKLSHVSLKHGEVLEEEWTLIAYPFGDYFLFDLLSEQTNTSQDTLFIVEYHYGGMGFRGSREWNDVDTLNYTNTWQILTSEGKTNEDANHTKAAWVDASGQIEHEMAGLTVFGFPDNFRYPQTIRVHPTMPYWVYAPMVDGEFYIAPGQTFKSKFRYLAHNDGPDMALINKLQADLTDPIQVKVID
ncbi:PmoA family protein [Negadavirga shengliensis]|uniref:PmoA family protein n=1 Tax=Negadavirga shengliensis TaxID=1389218 RepID=A0ABV9SZI2_9BACT